MRFPFRSQWHKYVAGVSAAAVLTGAACLALWFTGGDILYAVSSFSSAKIQDPALSLESEVEDAIRYNIPFRLELRDVYSAGLVAQGKRETGNFYIVKDNGGYLQQTNLYQEIDPDIGEYARRLGLLRQAGLLTDTKVLFVGTTGKFVPGTSEMPRGYPEDYAVVRNLDELFLDLLAYGVHNLDLREEFKSAPLSYSDYYYRTDSGWTAHAALFSANYIARTCRDTLGLSVGSNGFFGDARNYKTEIYPGILLGNYGRTAGVPFSGLDDFILLTPDFTTDLTVELPDFGVVRRGPFSESVLDTSFLQIENPRYDYPMGTFFGEDVTQARIINHRLPGREKVLFLCDSTFLTTAAYLALMCGELDVRVVNSGADMSGLETLAASGAYSLVIVACEAKSIGADMFPFYTPD